MAILHGMINEVRLIKQFKKPLHFIKKYILAKGFHVLFIKCFKISRLNKYSITLKAHGTKKNTFIKNTKCHMFHISIIFITSDNSKFVDKI
jgi:hypothetical protein